MVQASLTPRRGGALYPWLKPGLLLGAMVPLLSLALRAYTGQLGANPIAEALNDFGLLALIFLLASLACSPLKRHWGLTWPMRVRRMLGLLSFTYATLHLLTYVLLDRLGETETLIEDVIERPFITVGLLAWLLLVPLAITSTQHMLKRLGFRRWRRLHQLSYLVGLLAILHFTWRVKKDLSEPLTYGLVLLLLLGERVLHAVRAHRH